MSQTDEKIFSEQEEQQEEQQGEELSRPASVSSDQLEDIKLEGGHVNKDASVIESNDAPLSASTTASKGEEEKTSTHCGSSSLVKEETIGRSPSARESQTVERIASEQEEEEHEENESRPASPVSSDQLEDSKSEGGHHFNKDASIVASQEASVDASTKSASQGEDEKTSKCCGPSSPKDTQFARRPSPPRLSPTQQSSQSSKHPSIGEDYTKLHLQRSSMTTAPGAVAVGGDGEGDETKEEEISENAILPVFSDVGYGGRDVARMPPQEADSNDNPNDKYTYGGQGTDDYTHIPMITAELVTAPEPMVTAELVALAAPPVEVVTVHIDEVEAVTVHIDEVLPEESHSQDQARKKKRASIIKYASAAGVLALMLAIILVTTLNVTSNDGGASTFPYKCYTSTLDIINAQMESADQPATYITCPNTRIKVGNLASPAAYDFRFINGDYPIIVIKDDVTIQCGIDGRREDNCIIEDGLVQVLALNVFPRPDGTMEPTGQSTDNFRLRGITFTGEMARNDVFRGASVSISHPGRNMVIEDCLWENMTATAYGIISTARNLFLELTDIPLEPFSIELTLLNCRFSNIVYAFWVVENHVQTLNIDRCHFEDLRLSLLLQPCYSNGCSGLFFCDGDSFCSISDICVINFEIAGVAAMVTSPGTDFRNEGSNSLQGWTLSPSSDPSDFCEGGLARLLDDDLNYECIDVFDADSCVLDA
jgi:hypothetical protein